MTISHPLQDVLDVELMQEINAFAGEAALDEDRQVIVFQSADPDYFIIHGDMNFVSAPETLMRLDLGGVERSILAR